MTAGELLKELGRRGVRLDVEGDRLLVRAPRGVLDEEVSEAIRQHKEVLVATVGEVRARPQGPQLPPIRPRAPDAEPVLSPTQQRFWELQRLAPDPAVYNVPGAFRLTGPLDRGTLRDALQKMVDRHEVLRSRFFQSPDGARLEIADEVEVRLPVDDLSAVEPEARESALNEYLERWSDEPMDLQAGPPFAARLVALGSDEHALLFVGHSLTWDGWCFDLLLSELKAHYESRIGLDTAAEPPPLPFQFPDYAAWQRERADAGDLDASLTYWRRKLSGEIPSLGLPIDGERRLQAGHAGARVWYRLEQQVVDSVRELARSERATSYMIGLAAFNILLHRYSGVRDILVASPLQGRHRPELEDLVGVFVNTLFFRNRVEPDATFREVLREVSTTSLEAVENELAPSERVAEILREQENTRSPYEALFVFQQTSRRANAFGPVAVKSICHGTRRVAVDLTVWMREYDDYFDGAFDFRTDLFEAETVERMSAHLVRIIRQGTADPDRPISEIELADADELEQIASRARAQGAHILRDLGLEQTRSDGTARSIAILDAAGGPVPMNAEGELHLEGLEGGGGWEPTGLRARWSGRGELRMADEPMGDLAEVEAALASHPEVRRAAATTHRTNDGEARVVGYVEWGSAEPPLASELRRHVAGRLKGGLVPGVIVELDRMPTDEGGRVDERQLPNPFAGAARPEIRAPTSSTERVIAEIWTELLAVESVSTQDNFFELGGHSLLAIQATTLIEKRLGVEIDARATFFQTLRQIAKRIDAHAPQVS